MHKLKLSLTNIALSILLLVSITANALLFRQVANNSSIPALTFSKVSVATGVIIETKLGCGFSCASKTWIKIEFVDNAAKYTKYTGDLDIPSGGGSITNEQYLHFIDVLNQVNLFDTYSYNTNPVCCDIPTSTLIVSYKDLTKKVDIDRLTDSNLKSTLTELFIEIQNSTK